MTERDPTPGFVRASKLYDATTGNRLPLLDATDLREVVGAADTLQEAER